MKDNQKRKGGREKMFWGVENGKDAGRSSGSGSPGVYEALLPIFPKSQHNSLAGDGERWCCAGFGNNSMVAAQGLLIEPCHVAQGHSASLHTLRALRALPMGIRCQSHPLVDANNSSHFWAMNNSFSTGFPKARGTKSCLFPPLGFYQCFLTLSLQVLTHFTG